MPDPGIGVGTGGFFASLFNPGLASRVAQHITPDPRPLAQQGQPGQPGQVDILGNPVPSGPPPGANLAPAAATQGDPVNAKNISALTAPSSAAAEDYMRYQRMNALSADLNRNLEGVAAGFGTAQQQAAKQAALRGGGSVGDGLGDLAGIQKIQDQTILDNEHARFMGNAAIFAQTLSQQLGRPVSVQEAQMFQNNPDMLRAAAQAVGSAMTPTGTSKDFAAAQAATAAQVKAEHPDWTEAQIQKEVNTRVPPSMMMQGLGPLSDQEYRQYAAAEQAAGRTPLGPVEWQEQQKNKAITQETQTKQSTEFRDQGIQDFDIVHPKLNITRDRIKSLLSNMDATMSALKYPALFTTGPGGAMLPDWANVGGYGLPDSNTKQAAVAMQGLISDLTGAGLSNVKNMRNVREFNTLGTAATAGLNAAAGKAAVQKTLEDMLTRADTADANAYAVAGKVIPNQYTGKADERYTSKTLDGKDNPYYTGASYEPQDTKKDGGGAGGANAPSGGGGKPLPDATDQAIQQKLKDSPGEKAALIKHFEDLGFDMSKYK